MSSRVQTLGWTPPDMTAKFQQVLEEHRKEVGARVAARRNELGLSQELLAHEAKVSTKTVSRIENGEHDTRGLTMKKIAGALDVKLGDLLAPPKSAREQTQLDRIEAQLAEILRRLPEGVSGQVSADLAKKPPPRGPRLPKRASGQP